MDKSKAISPNTKDAKTIAKQNKKFKIKNRIWELDAIRGFCILLMIMDHFFFSAGFLYGPEWFGRSLIGDSGLAQLCRNARWYYYCIPRQIIQPTIVFIFIALCGLSCGFSRNNLKRGLQLAFVACIVSLVSCYFDDGRYLITFGILHMLAFCIITWSIIQFLCKDKKLQLLISFTLLFLIASIYFATFKNPELNETLNQKIFFLTHSTHGNEKSPGDLFALIPWSGIFFLCAGITNFLYPDKKTLMPRLDGKWHRPICFVGRHTLIIYLLHQVVICGIFELISYFSTGSFVFIPIS